MGRVQGKVAIVTGGAMGIGEATARMLAREGAMVVVTDLKDAEGERVAKAIDEAGGEAIFQHHDVADEASWEKLMATTLERYGRLDVLVNNAGVLGMSAPEDQTLDAWRRLMSVNLDGTFLGCKHAIRTMKRNQPPGGSIVNLSSTAGLVGNPNLGAYNASKGGVRIYTKSIALDCAKYGIRVNSVHPGGVWTPMVEQFLRAGGQDPAQARAGLDASHPIGHMGEPDDIAYGILFLASNESKFMTGAELVIDGGMTAQ